MARGSLSPESVLVRQLDALGCSHRNFCLLADFKSTTLSEILSSARDFTPEEKDKVESVVQEMISLRAETAKLRGMPLSLNWADPAVGIALVVGRIAAINRETGSHTLDEVEQQVIGRIARQ